MIQSINQSDFILTRYIYPKLVPQLQKLIDEQDDDIKNELKKFNISNDLLFFLERNSPCFLNHFLNKEFSLFFNTQYVKKRIEYQQNKAKILGFNECSKNISFNCFLCVNSHGLDKNFMSLEYFIMDFLNKEKIKQLKGFDNFYNRYEDVNDKYQFDLEYQEFINFDLFRCVEIVDFFDLFIFSLEEKQKEWKHKKFFKMIFNSIEPQSKAQYSCTIFNAEDFIHLFIEEKKLNLEKISQFSLKECFAFCEEFFNQFEPSVKIC